MTVDRKKIYIAVIGDLVKSRGLVDRGSVQDRLRSTLDEINEREADGLMAPFRITQGDEFQGLLKSKASLSSFWWTFQERMRLHAMTRFGIGVGPVATAFRSEPGEMDGPCFHAARAAIRWGHRKRSNLVFRFHGQEEAGEALSRLSDLVDKTVVGWTDVQWETVGLLRELGSQIKVAERRGVTHQSVGDVLTSSLGGECLDAWLGLEQLVSQFSQEKPYVS